MGQIRHGLSFKLFAELWRFCEPAVELGAT